jgi:hypothetical protein
MRLAGNACEETPMKPVRLGDGVIEIEASVIAEGLHLPLPLLRQQMRAGRITSLFDERGAIIQRSAVNFGDRRLPRSARNQT